VDVVRPRRRTLPLRTLAVCTLGLVVALLAAWSLPVLFERRDAGPSVARADLVIGTVTSGSLEDDVLGAGLLAPDRIHVVASVSDGIVASVFVRPGQRVSAASAIARLENPELDAAVVDVAAQLTAARAEVESAREEAAAARLDAESVLRSARAESSRASAQAASDGVLHAKGYIADLPYQQQRITAQEDRDLVAIDERKVAIGGAGAAAKVATAQARVDQLVAELAARRAEVATLTVFAGAAGVGESVAVDPGQRVTSGTEFARIADDRDLKAVLQIAESDVRGIAPGERVRIVASDAGQTLGRVTRLAPSAQNGTVAVDVALDRIPPGARADQNVDGTVVIRRATNVLSLARPANANDGSRIALYRLDRDATHAYRTEVTLGYGSDDRVRILSGLNAGDRVVISDTSAFDAPTLRITQ
jgi:HlyD family secretion protein